jgi:hypothetical protein
MGGSKTALHDRGGEDGRAYEPVGGRWRLAPARSVVARRWVFASGVEHILGIGIEGEREDPRGSVRVGWGLDGHEVVGSDVGPLALAVHSVLVDSERRSKS